jgi:ABC-type antimicrobial peptide transport system permease subunit
MTWNMNCGFIIVFYMVLLLHKCIGISSWPVQFVFNNIIVSFSGSVLIAFLTLHPEIFYDLNKNFILCEGGS